MIKFASTLLLTVLCTQPMLAATNPWFGTWKLDQDKSTLTGDAYTVDAIPGGYRFHIGKISYDLLEDGKDYPMPVSGATSTLTKTGRNDWLRVNKTNGKETSRTIWKLSDDGKSMTLTSTGTEADGTSYQSERTITRIGNSSGAAGTWKQGKYVTSVKPTAVYSDGGNGSLKIEDVQAKSTTLVTFDGKPVTSSGPRESADRTQTYLRVSPTKFKYTEFVKGKPLLMGVETLSADGRTLTDVNWMVDKPANKYTAIWDKQ